MYRKTSRKRHGTGITKNTPYKYKTILNNKGFFVDMKLIAQGAEAKLYRENATIIKERLAKAYRHPDLDQSLRQFRTRREAKVLQKLEDLQFPAPHLREFSDKRMSIVMDFVAGETLKEALQQKEDNSEHLAREIA